MVDRAEIQKHLQGLEMELEAEETLEVKKDTQWQQKTK